MSYSSQNTFEINGKADTRTWVFIPVRIISKRTPENQKFHAFPIYDGVAERDFDIYNPESYPEISPYFEDEMMPQSSRCIKSVGSSQTVGRIHIRSDGLNYRGTYDVKLRCITIFISTKCFTLPATRIISGYKNFCKFLFRILQSNICCRFHECLS
jgi:hypothetical protein